MDTEDAVIERNALRESRKERRGAVGGRGSSGIGTVSTVYISHSLLNI